jgi:hypothetical protein
MKYLPIGIQTLTKLREKNCIYVDKTRLIHHLLSNGSVYFLSRPRRFGKSLLISTIKELVSGNKAVFEGTWIADQWDWSKTNPVIHISFDAADYRGQGLGNAISYELKEIAEKYAVVLEETGYKLQFKELLKKLNETYGKVVFLIDEYDKPITDFLEASALEEARKNQVIMKDFYSVLKSSDDLLEFVFITGITKFTKVSFLSDLNNLKDITLAKDYAALTGYTQEELESYFDDYLQRVAKELQLTREALLQHTKTWYNGYSWDGETKVYNPFGTLNFLDERRFKNFWFATGSPSFLIKLMRNREVFNVENTVIDSTLMEKYDLENLELVPLLFQAGYLTVKSVDLMNGDLLLDYPNKEVRESMYLFLIHDIAGR